MFLHELLETNRYMKIKKGHWHKSLYIQISECGNYFVDQEGEIYDMFPDDILSNSWVQYK